MQPASEMAHAPACPSPSSTPPRPTHSRRAGILAKTLIAIAGLGLVGGVSYAMLGTGAGAGDVAQGSTLDIQTVVRATFDITTTSNGELEAKNQIEIRNRIEQQATITEIIEEGKLVKKGELLVKLNDDTILTNINEEMLRVETAKAELIQADEAFGIQVSENESALRQAELKVELARLSLQQWQQGEVMSTRQENELALDKAQRELVRLDEKYEQSKALEAQGFLSKDELKQDELRYIEALASVAKAKLAQEVYEEFQHPKDEKQKTSDLEEAKAELERVGRKNESELASKRADLENKKRQLALREEKLTKLQQQLAACTMLAPADGLVVYSTSTERGSWSGDGPLQIGRQVFPNQLLIVLPDTTEMVASVKVHESIAGRVRPGLPATVKIDAAGGRTFNGRVMSIGVLAESSGRWMDPNLREYTVKIALDSIGDAGLKPSMRCESEIRLGRVDDAIAVPMQAVFNDGFIRYVYVPSGSKYVRRPVKLGRRSDRLIEITAGVEPGERVLLRQPAAGEILGRPWSDTELAAVGLRQDERGKVEPLESQTAAGAPAGDRTPGARPARTGGPSRETTQSRGQPAAAETPAAAAPSPSETAPAESASAKATTETPAPATEAATDSSTDAPAETAPVPAAQKTSQD